MQTHKDHHCSIQQEIEGLQLTLQVDVSTGSFENLALGPGIYPLALTAEDRSDLLAKAASQALVAARHQFHQSLGLSFIALKQAENDRLATPAGKNKDKFTPPGPQETSWLEEINDLKAGTKSTVVLSAPPCWGKTVLSKMIADKFGCVGIQDDWNPARPLFEGHLHLTNVHPHELRHLNAIVIERGWK